MLDYVQQMISKPRTGATELQTKPRVFLKCSGKERNEIKDTLNLRNLQQLLKKDLVLRVQRISQPPWVPRCLRILELCHFIFQFLFLFLILICFQFVTSYSRLFINYPGLTSLISNVFGFFVLCKIQRGALKTNCV